MAKLNFNTSGKEDMEDFTVVPPDTYNAQITKSEMKPTKDKTGKRLNLTFKIIDGKFKGRMVFAGLNIENKSQDAVDISMRELTSIVKACGKKVIGDTAEIHGIPLTISVKVKPASGNFSEQNQITKYKKYGVVETDNKTDSASDEVEETESDEASDEELPWAAEE